MVITFEKLYLSNPKNCLVKLGKLCENNRLTLKQPNIIQLRNYIYKYREQLIAENYPEVKEFLSEIIKKTYTAELRSDELFFIYSHIENGEISLLFSAKALIENLLKQQQLQPSFIHLDTTFKLIDLGLPLFVVSTENVNHNYRPVAFFVSWSESTAQTTLMLKKLADFLQESFDFAFKPKFVLTDNSDALISGCKQAFSHEYVHLACHFHIAKNVKEKVQSKLLKDKKQILFFGLKVLKNSPSLPFFKRVWEIVKKYWQDNGVEISFISTFEKEYILKGLEWHYGSAFPGKSRTNNSIESGNNVLKRFFNRKAHNFKEFLGKMREFIQEWATLDKTSFPYQPTHSLKILQEAKERANIINFFLNDTTPNLLYYPRKGVSKEILNIAFQKVLTRKNLPEDIDNLHQGWCYFRTINKSMYTCDCANFYKLNFCKHSLAMKIIQGEIQDPVLKQKKQRGRKANISKALEGKNESRPLPIQD